MQTVDRTACTKCGEPCYYDFTKMVQCNKRNGKKHWCPYGDLPINTKCKHCGADLVFNRLHYDDIRGTLNIHRCLTAAKKKHMLL